MPFINGNFYANPAYGQHIEDGSAENAAQADTGDALSDEGSDWANESEPDPATAQAPAQPQAAPRQQPQPAQPQPQDRLTAEQQRRAAALAYSETTDGTQAEHEAMISVLLNRANSRDRQFVNHGQAVNVDNVMGATAPNGLHQFQGFGGDNYTDHLGGRANNQGARNATAAAANISRNGPTNGATFTIVSQRPPTPRQERSLGNVHRVGQVGRVYLYVPGPVPQ